MKLFLRRILLFFGPILLALCVGEYLIQNLPNSYKVQRAYLKANAHRVETLILGSSHTYYGVNPRFFTSKAFNASNVSQSPDVDFAVLKSYEDKLQGLSTVVIRLSYDTLFEQLKDSPEDWRLKNYKLYTDINFDYKFTHNSEILSTGVRQVLKVLKDYYIDQNPLLNCDSLGWGNDLSQRLKTDIDNVGVVAAKRHTAKTWELLRDNVEIFRQIIEWCKDRNIEVIIVSPPAYNSYTDNLNQKQLEKMIKVGRELKTNYSNCYYYNFLVDKRFKKEDFYDGDHLNGKGAKKFTLIINSLIEN